MPQHVRFLRALIILLTIQVGFLLSTSALSTNGSLSTNETVSNTTSPSLPLCSSSINAFPTTFFFHTCVVHAFGNDVNIGFAFSFTNTAILCRTNECITALNQFKLIVNADCTMMGTNETIHVDNIQQLVAACSAPTPTPSPTTSDTNSNHHTLGYLGVALGVCVVLSCVTIVYTIKNKHLVQIKDLRLETMIQVVIWVAASSFPSN